MAISIRKRRKCVYHKILSEHNIALRESNALYVKVMETILPKKQ